MSARTRVATLTLTLLSLTACGPSADEFRETDPNGYSACGSFEQADGAGGDVYRASISAAARSGLEASTPGIRDAVDDQNNGAGGDPVIPNLGAFEHACKAAGYDF